MAKLRPFEFLILLGQQQIAPKKRANQNLRVLERAYNSFNSEIDYYATKYRCFGQFLERGLINPFASQICDGIDHFKRLNRCGDSVVDIFLISQLSSIEQIVRRALVLEMNIANLTENKNKEQANGYLNRFSQRFRKKEECQQFFDKYPVIFRMVSERIRFWLDTSTELLKRLETDRVEIETHTGISRSSALKSVTQSGDTHCGGRSVTVLQFVDDSCLIYKPRSVDLEYGFQEYLRFFNSNEGSLNLKTIKVLPRIGYGWIEFVKYQELSSKEDGKLFYQRLGLILAITYSINGVDIFFENLIASGPDPVVIDCEAMFHTFIEPNDDRSPVKSLQRELNKSVIGIGILPQPGIGASDTAVFDVTVMGARVDAKAPYTVMGMENFGHASMRFTEIPGWIPENRAGSADDFSRAEKGHWVLKGLEIGLSIIHTNIEIITAKGGIVDSCFKNSIRRLIVRDTKIYGSLQQDETHPDLTRDQLDREWYWDNLWSELSDRPVLSLFINSEISQTRQGDIPYFYGSINSLEVTGGDGSTISLASYISNSPLTAAKQKLRKLTSLDIARQLRFAATTLGLDNILGLTQPKFDPAAARIDNALTVGEHVITRLTECGCYKWCDTSTNPAPKARDVDAVAVVPSDPFMYDGMAGVAMFLNDLGLSRKRNDLIELSVELANAIIIELAESANHPISGFCGLGSVVYVLNRCQSRNKDFEIFNKDIERIIASIRRKLSNELRMDFLLGISGTGLSILPYAKRTASDDASKIITKIYERLLQLECEIFSAKEPPMGMEYLRGLSHGISGLALAIYRIGEFLNDKDAHLRAARLIRHEAHLVAESGWTDSHKFAGEPLVGWCHGSAGILLALKEMPDITHNFTDIGRYYEYAKRNTLEKGSFPSGCLCHGRAGNIISLSNASIPQEIINRQMFSFENSIFKSGFSSLGAAQTMGVGLMTGISGLGYYFLKDTHGINLDFLTLN